MITKIILTIQIYFLINVLFGQSVEVIHQTDMKITSKSNYFIFTPNIKDAPKTQYLATMKVSGKGKNADLSKLFTSLKSKAVAIGANLFTLDTFQEKNNKNIASMTAKVYYLAEDQLKASYANPERNAVYLFGHLEADAPSIDLNINDSTQSIPPGQFIKLTILSGETYQLKKEGITGASVRFEWVENKAPVYISISGVSISPDNSMDLSDISIKTGDIQFIDAGLGRLLVYLFKK